jgi:hypothetical protein
LAGVSDWKPAVVSSPNAVEQRAPRSPKFRCGRLRIPRDGFAAIQNFDGVGAAGKARPRV